MLRARVSRWLAPDSPLPAARRMRALEVLLNLMGIVSVAVGTLTDVPPWARTLSAVVTGLVAIFFLLEYLLRLWVAPELARWRFKPPAQARWRWAASWVGVVDLLAVLPALAALTGGARLGAESAAVFVLLWVLKLATRSSGVSLIARVIRNERSSLGAAAALFLIVLFAAATIAHWVEGETQPAHFGSIPAALWWAVVTLTTTGYGDVVPQSVWGRMLGGLLMLTGIVVMALLAGILATGFAEEVRRREYLRIWDLVARVPFFAQLDAIAIADIVGRLRTASFKTGATVFHHGSPGDAMYFLVSGSVRVQLGPRSKVLREGEFFGEMALIERKPRSAEVVALEPCSLLVLDVAAFYQLAGQQPELMHAFKAEARRRLDEDLQAGVGV